MNFETMFFEYIVPIPATVPLFFVIYGITGVVPLFAALYLLLRRGNAFAPDVTPPLRLRRWAASFFGVSVLGHVWWYLFYIYSADYHSLDDLLYSRAYLTMVMLDFVTLLTTIAGTLLAMLQDRRRPVWPIFVAMLPLAVLWVALLFRPSYGLFQTAVCYLLLVYALFTVYVTLAVRQYGRWLRDNFADLERKEVWLSNVLTIIFMLAVIFYMLVEGGIILYYLLHLTQLMLFVLLLWRVETLPQLSESSTAEGPLGIATREPSFRPSVRESAEGTARLAEPPAHRQLPTAVTTNVNMTQMERLLTERCVDTHLYLQHDLTLIQLAAALNTNRSYLSKYFSCQNITYNTYINNLRINYFVRLYQEASATGKPFTVQQLASESGYRSYSTFSLAFKQRMGRSVTAWMHRGV